MTYIIGDVHGEFDSLRILADKFPKDTELYRIMTTKPTETEKA